MKTRNGFLRAFRKVAKDFSWEIKEDGRIRGRNNSGCYCPITAVYHARTGESVCISEFRKIGMMMGLNNAECCQIVDAADLSEDSKYYNTRTRKALERAAGL